VLRMGIRWALWMVAAMVVLEPSSGGAEPPQPSPAKSPAKTKLVPSEHHCVFRGVTKLGREVSLYDQPQGGKALARFTGGSIEIGVGPFPTDSSGRVPVTTGTGMGSFRFEGFVDIQAVPMFAARDVPVIPKHLWIAAAQAVTVVGAVPGKLEVRKTLAPPLSVHLEARAPCNHFTLVPKTGRAWSPPAGARGHLVGEDPAQLFASPQAPSPVGALKGARGMFLWGMERKDDFVHLVHHGDVAINAWGRLKEFPPAPPVDMSEGLIPLARDTTVPTLWFDGTSRLVKTKAEATLWSSASTRATAIGRIEVGTETYVLEVVAGWANVLPKSLNLAPPSDQRFWVKAADLGL
jgi:hypothetical protein